MKQYQEDKETAISSGAVKIGDNDAVVPLWHLVPGMNIADFKLGRPISDEDYSATAYIMVQKADGKSDIKSVMQMQLRGDRRTSTIDRASELTGKIVNFMAIDKGDRLNDSRYTNFVIDEEQPEVSISKLLADNAKDNCVKLKDVPDFYSRHAENIFNTAAFIKCTVTTPVVSEARESNFVQVLDSGFDGTFYVYMPKHLGVPTEGSEGVVFGGRLRKNENNQESPYSLNAFMMYEPKQIGIVAPSILSEVVSKQPEKQEQVKSVSLAKEDW
jgi:hypothetical protein